jgi:hypothetical protein
MGLTRYGMRLGAAGVAVTLVLLVGAAPAAAASTESISTYDTQLTIDTAGLLHVTETIDYDFGTNQRHGIFRDIPTRFSYDDTHTRVYPLGDIAVTMDGHPEQFDHSNSGDVDELKIGDPDNTVTGTHRYVIAYTARGALNHFDDHEELYWNAIGTEWTVPITTATATVTGPVDLTKAQCFAGPEGSRLACASATVNGPTASFAGSDLGNRSGLSVVVALPVGSVGPVAPILEQKRDWSTAFRVNPWIVAIGLLLALGGIGGALALAFLVGRDRRYLGQLPGLTPGYGEAAVEARKPLFGKPPVSVEFGPPDKVKPGQVGTLIDELANVLDVTATILDFAVRRHLHITEIPREGRWGSQDWEISKLTDGDPAFLPYERKLFDSLFDERTSVKLSELKYTFAKDLAEVQQQLYGDMVTQGWYRRSPAATRLIARWVAAGLLVVSVAFTCGLSLFGAGLVGLGLIVAAVAALFVSGSFPARTGRGSAMLARIQGFRLYIATAEAEQIKFQEREQIFSEFLPYAIVFGLADRWAGLFAQIGSVATDGRSGLYWYTGQPGWSMLYFGASIGSFTTATAGTIATTPPSATGSSGFSGGFSGGGGGGGGGGSW